MAVHLSFYLLNDSWTRVFELVTHLFELVTREFKLVNRGFKLVIRRFELVVTRKFELEHCIWTCKLVDLNSHCLILTRVFKLLTRN